MQETKATKEYWAAVQASREGMDSLDIAAQNTSIVPLIGDALGVASDVKQYVKGEKELTPINAVLSAVGALPFVPSPSQVRKIVGRPEEKQAKVYEEKEAEITKGDKNYTLSLTDMVKLEKASGVWRGADGVLRTNYSAKDTKLNRKFHDMNSGTPGGSASFPYVTPSGVGYEVSVSEARRADVTDFLENLPEIPGVDFTDTKLVKGYEHGFGGGWFDSQANEMSLNSTMTEDAAKRLALHEVGHKVQKDHSLHGGDAPENFLDFLTQGDKKKRYLPEAQKKADAAYRRSLGEIDAETAAVFDTYVRHDRPNAPSFVQAQDAYVRSLLEKEGIFIDSDVPAQIFGALLVPERARRNK